MERLNWIWADHYDHPVDWKQEFPPLSLPEMFARSAERSPKAPLIDFYRRRFSYGEVYQAARRFAHGLIRLGIEPGDRVGIHLPNVPHYLVAYYGAMMAGAVVVNFSPLYTAQELDQQAEDSGTRLLVTLSTRSLFETARSVLDGSCVDRLVVASVVGALPTGKALFYRLFKHGDDAHVPRDKHVLAFSQLLDNAADEPLPPIDAVRDLALLQYTGGTTGTPKAAMLTHQNLTANARQVLMVDGRRDEPDRMLGVLPFFHVFANTAVLNRTVANGGQIVMLPRFDVDQVLAAIGRAGITCLPGVPTMFQALLDSPALATANLASLRLCISGGAPLSASLRTAFEAATGARLVEGYGLTESSGVVSVNPFDLPGKSGTVGQPLPATRVKLLDRDDPSRSAAPGVPGEIAVAGPQIMRGYWRAPAEDDQVFVDGFMRTGDVGTIDEDGYIRVVDRLKEMISVGGFKVFPSQIEALLDRHPAVREALVIGIPDPYRGESPKAFVTLRSPAVGDFNGEMIKAWLNPQLGKHERVVAVEIRDSLPKTLIGKLARKELVAEERAKAGLS